MLCGRLACGRPGLTVTDAQAEFDRGDFLRTHILRPTWHFVAAEDIRWILEVTAPRVQKLNQTIYRQERLDPATLDRGLALIVEELEGGRYRTRAELGQALADQGLVGQRLGLAYIVMNAELEGVICSGPMRGAQQTYALLDERAPRSADAAARRRRRAGAPILPGSRPGKHPGPGPLVLSHHQPVPGRVEAIRDRLDCVTVEGVELWFDPDAPPVGRRGRSAATAVRRADLELSVDQLSASDGHPHAPGEDLFVGSVIIAETNVGTWRRTVQGRKMIMEIALAPGVVARSRALVEAAASKLATFAGRTWS